MALTKCSFPNCSQLLLEASPKGETVYKQLGFVRVVEQHAGVFLSLKIATQSCPWQSLFVLLELLLKYKNYFVVLKQFWSVCAIVLVALLLQHMCTFSLK